MEGRSIEVPSTSVNVQAATQDVALASSETNSKARLHILDLPFEIVSEIFLLALCADSPPANARDSDDIWGYGLPERRSLKIQVALSSICACLFPGCGAQDAIALEQN